MRKPLVAGNWKMNGSAESAVALAETITGGAPGIACEVGVCPPFPFLPAVAGALGGSQQVWLGGQTVSEHAPGAYTGEVAADMLVQVGCSRVLVGHSERRHLFGETDEQICAKFRAAQAAGLVPVLCVGEQLSEREQGATEEVVARQLAAVMEGCGIEAFDRAVVAYEPVWAIGTGKTAGPDQAQAVHAFIRRLVGKASAPIAAELRILYGGSVKADNAVALFSMPDIDGGLIGGASLDASQFLSICRAAA